MSELKSWPWSKQVAFKGANGKYLIPQTIEDHQYLKFASDNIQDDKVKNDIFPVDEETIRIKNTTLGKFWKRSIGNWILANSDGTPSTDPDTLFKTDKLSESVAAFKNKGNERYSVMSTATGKEDCLNAVESDITKEARLQVINLGP